MSGSPGALREARRVLRPGGRPLIGDWFVSDGQAQYDCHGLAMGMIKRPLVRAGFRSPAVDYVGADGRRLLAR